MPNWKVWILVLGGLWTACSETIPIGWQSVPYQKMVLTADTWQYRPIGKPLDLPALDSLSLERWQRFIEDSLPLTGSESLIPLSYALFLEERDSRYMDFIERSLWNDGLVQAYSHQEKTYHPGAFAYATGPDSLWVNLYLDGSTQMYWAGSSLTLRVATEYPWEESVRIELQMNAPKQFALGLRIPGFARNLAAPGSRYQYLYHSNRKLELRVNDDLVMPDGEAGYAIIDRKWENGDFVELRLPLAVRRVRAEADSQRIALERGPLVYALAGTEENLRLSGSRQYFVRDSSAGKYQVKWLDGPVWQEDQWESREAAPLFHLEAERIPHGPYWLAYR